MTQSSSTPAPAPRLAASVYRYPGGCNVAVIAADHDTVDRWTFDGDDVATELAARGYLAIGAELQVAPNLGVTPLATCSSCSAALPPAAAGGDGRCGLC
jgi:hypothetical protein